MSTLSANPLSAAVLNTPSLLIRALGADDFLWSALFANGELGGVYIAKSAQSYQTTSGQNLAAADNVVGLALDQSQGLEVGPELLPDAFGVPGDWTINAGWGMADGAATHTGSDPNKTSQLVYSADTALLTQYTTYLVSITFSVLGASATGVRVVLGGSYAGTITAASPGAYTARLLCAASDDGSIALQADNADAADKSITMTDVSVRQLAGWHANQSNAGQRPILRISSGKYSWQSDLVDDALVATFDDSLGSDCTIMFADAAGVTTQTGQTIGATFDVLQSEYIHGLLVIDRALTAGESATAAALLAALR